MKLYDIIVRGIGILGILAVVLAFQCRKHSHILIFRAANEFLFAVQYLLFGIGQTWKKHPAIGGAFQCPASVPYYSHMAGTKKYPRRLGKGRFHAGLRQSEPESGAPGVPTDLLLLADLRYSAQRL